MPALIFDCDGVLADTEKDGHLPAFNATFTNFRLPVQWDVPTYAQKVKIGGGKERMSTLLTTDFLERTGLPADPEEQREVVAQWHAYKTAQYTALIESGVLPARPGIARIAAAADAAGWRLAVASTSARPAVESVLRHAVGEDLAARFDVFAGDIVGRKKPHPDIYLLAISELGLPAEECIVVEDSEVGLRAAYAAGLRVVITVSGFTREEDFAGASLVVSSLGDPPPGETARTLDDPLSIEAGDWLDLSTLAGLIALPRPPRPHDL